MALCRRLVTHRLCVDGALVKVYVVILVLLHLVVWTGLMFVDVSQGCGGFS